MEYKKAMEILMGLAEKYPLSADEIEAVTAAAGALDSASLADNRLKRIMKTQKAKRDKSRGI